MKRAIFLMIVFLLLPRLTLGQSVTVNSVTGNSVTGNSVAGNVVQHQASSPAYLTLISAEGQERLRKASHNADYIPLSASFTTQITQTLCSIASAVTVLNALQIARPIDPTYYPYHYFTQNNFFTENVLKIRNYASVLANGLTLDLAAQAIETHGAKARPVHAEDITIENFRSALKDNLSRGGDYIIANYQRQLIGQPKGAHFAPLGAYDEASDTVLIFDVARYKFPPVWVKTADLYAAMLTQDSEAPRSRGFIQVFAAK